VGELTLELTLELTRREGGVFSSDLVVVCGSIVVMSGSVRRLRSVCVGERVKNMSSPSLPIPPKSFPLIEVEKEQRSFAPVLTDDTERSEKISQIHYSLIEEEKTNETLLFVSHS
jgi:hypothetical protein